MSHALQIGTFLKRLQYGLLIYPKFDEPMSNISGICKTIAEKGQVPIRCFGILHPPEQL
jgi:hypothetical protein